MMKPTPVDMPGLTNARILALVVGDITYITLALGFLTKPKKIPLVSFVTFASRCV